MAILVCSHYPAARFVFGGSQIGIQLRIRVETLYPDFWSKIFYVTG